VICANGNARIGWKLDKRFGHQEENKEKTQGKEWVK
jgi:hypothetical protein